MTQKTKNDQKQLGLDFTAQPSTQTSKQDGPKEKVLSLQEEKDRRRIQEYKKELIRKGF